MPEGCPADHRHIPQLRGGVAPLHHGDHTGFADALPGQAEDQCVELRLGQRLVHEQGSNEAALMKAPSTQPDADAVVHEYLAPVTAAIGGDVGVGGWAAPNTATTRPNAESVPARMSIGSTDSHSASTRITAAPRAPRSRSPLRP